MMLRAGCDYRSGRNRQDKTADMLAVTIQAAAASRTRLQTKQTVEAAAAAGTTGTVQQSVSSIVSFIGWALCFRTPKSKASTTHQKPMAKR